MRKWKNNARLTLSYTLLLLISVVAIYPALWVVLSSLRPGGSLYSEHFWPRQFTLVHYAELFTSKAYLYGTWYLNTLKIAVVTMILSTILVTLSMYALSRFRFRGRKTALTVMLVLGMFPSFMSLIAIYIILLQLNLLDTHMALILVYSAGAALGGFIVKGFFDTIPRSLDEAARIDGASHLQVFAKIMLPLSKPMLTYVALTSFTGVWGDFIFARLVLRTKENWTVAVGMWDLVNSLQNSNFTMFAAGSVLIAIPITLLFIFLQRFLVQGLTSGASKG
ncbi:arabinogalactan oligomer / maltooligosaccharide transport system permease protein [Paenibacillus algorifonticola]|uniref:Arabinogalactan oligomer / maltooligosaccharide transport system permease protein n=1 Tax=Paenibacillus algorifonticola TaxID=684063 RepID=A0A1I2F8Y1_9BACL|nr:sugar ABC transporter permease [Paenibacillus algorifonticola]SFF01409.1 arabinogalactan oligomer / maltooligosaccharide transport system permease protein [Paenibacillus algorifonticola]